ATQAFADAKPAKTGALDPQEFKSFVLIEKEKLTHNTLRLRFELPNNQVSGLNVASCLVTKAVMGEGAEAKPVVRPYTPTSAPDARGYMDLVVKVGGLRRSPHA
ncbi:FAD-binding FR-type domain-containing protein, partial [Haematococcus lacustris]